MAQLALSSSQAQKSLQGGSTCGEARVVEDGLRNNAVQFCCVYLRQTIR